MIKKVVDNGASAAPETVEQTTTEQASGQTQEGGTTADTASGASATDTEEKTVVIDTKTALLGALGVVGVLGSVYFIGRYFGYQAALRAVAAAASQA